MKTRTRIRRKAVARTPAPPAPISAPPARDDGPAPDIGARLGAAAQGHSFGALGVSAAPRGAIQPKLTVGAPDDQYEHEADQVAGQVMRMPDPTVQRAEAPEEEEDLVQTKPAIQRVERGGSSDQTVVQRKFTVAGVEYNSDNKDSLVQIPTVRSLMQRDDSLAAFMDKLYAMAGVVDDEGTYENWPQLLSSVQNEVARDAKQLSAAARQIMTRFPPDKFAYIGLGGSPDIILRAIKRIDSSAAVLTLPFSNLSATSITQLAIDSLGKSDEELQQEIDKRVGSFVAPQPEETQSESEESEDEDKEHFLFADDNVNQALELEEELIKVPNLKSSETSHAFHRMYGTRPALFRDIITEHLNNYIGLARLSGRARALVVDFTATGTSLRLGAKMIAKYYGDRVDVSSFAITAEDNVKGISAKIDSTSGVDVAHLAKVLQDTTYKNSHRMHGRYDMLDVGLGIQNYVKAPFAGQGKDRPEYVAPGFNQRAQENVDALLDYGEEGDI